MAAPNRDTIRTNRGELWVNPTAIRKPGVGSVTFSGSLGGSVTALTVDGVSIITNAVAGGATHADTAEAVAAEINRTVSSPQYGAWSNGAVVYFIQATPVAGTLTVVCTVTTMTATKADLTGGALGSGGSRLGYTERGVSVRPNDQYVKDTTDETGASLVQIFNAEGSPTLSVVLKQWDPQVLNARYPGKWNGTKGGVEFPGGTSVAAGSSQVSNAVVLEFRPESYLGVMVLARKAILVGRADADIELATGVAKKSSLEFDLLADESIASNSSKYQSRVAYLGYGSGAEL